MALFLVLSEEFKYRTGNFWGFDSSYLSPKNQNSFAYAPHYIIWEFLVFFSLKNLKSSIFEPGIILNFSRFWDPTRNKNRNAKNLKKSRYFSFRIFPIPKPPLNLPIFRSVKVNFTKIGDYRGLVNNLAGLVGFGSHKVICIIDSWKNSYFSSQYSLINCSIYSSLCQTASPLRTCIGF